MSSHRAAIAFTAVGFLASLTAVGIISNGVHSAGVVGERTSPAASVPSAAPAGNTTMADMSAPMTQPAPAAAAQSPMGVDAHDAMMAARTKSFPAKTAGVGGQLLAPTVLADGTKQFDLTARVIKWEMEPGRIVDALAYNGAVPGPTLKVAVGDKLRIVLHNELPSSTAIHFHGVRVPNAMDGVPDITQPPVKPGTTFTYAFTATEPAVGMYHSHDDAQIQVPAGLAGAGDRR